MPSIDPTSAQFKDFMTADITDEIHMLNLLKFREAADYTGYDDLPCTGEEAYGRYMEATTPIIQEIGATVITKHAVRRSLIGPEEETWDIAFIVRYPNRAAMQAMLTNPAYQAIVYHRNAALADSRLIELAP